jgi:hypothetical protein
MYRRASYVVDCLKIEWGIVDEVIEWEFLVKRGDQGSFLKEDAEKEGGWLCKHVNCL